jgi:hypothetical protein
MDKKIPAKIDIRKAVDCMSASYERGYTFAG